MRHSHPSTSPKRVLFIRFSSIGDIVLTTPVIRAFHKQFPNTTIDFLIKDQFRDLIAHHPGVDKVRTIPHDLPLGELLRLRRDIQSHGNYDLIIDLHDNLRSKILTLRSPVPFVRYRKDRLNRWLYIYWKIRTPRVEKYITDRYFEPVESLGIRDDGEGLDFYFPEDFEYKTAALQSKVGAFHQADLPVTVAPGAAWQTKKWMPERFAGVCDRLISDLGATIALLGGPDEKTLAQEIINQMASPKQNLFNFAGESSLLESAAILRGASLHLANDSGLTHIATAFNCPVVALLGPTAKPTVFHPKFTEHRIVEDADLRCRPCTHMGRKRCPLGHFHCMKNITPDAVFAACMELVTS